MGFCLFTGNDIDQTTSPLEAGLGWITKLNKMDFIGKEFLDKQNEIGVERKLVGLKLNEKSVARHGYEIFFWRKKIGIITSGTFSLFWKMELRLVMSRLQNHKLIQI